MSVCVECFIADLMRFSVSGILFTIVFIFIMASPKFRTFRWYSLLSAIAIDISIHIIPLVFAGSGHASRDTSFGYQTMITSLQTVWMLGFATFIGTTVRKDFLYKPLHAIMVFTIVILAAARVFLSTVALFEPFIIYMPYKHIVYTGLTVFFVAYVGWAAVFRSELYYIESASKRKKIFYAIFMVAWFISEYLALAWVEGSNNAVYQVPYLISVAISTLSILAVAGLSIGVLITDAFRDDEIKINILQGSVEFQAQLLMLENSTARNTSE